MGRFTAKDVVIVKGEVRLYSYLKQMGVVGKKEPGPKNHIQEYNKSNRKTLTQNFVSNEFLLKT